MKNLLNTNNVGKIKIISPRNNEITLNLKHTPAVCHAFSFERNYCLH